MPILTSDEHIQLTRELYADDVFCLAYDEIAKEVAALLEAIEEKFLSDGLIEEPLEELIAAINLRMWRGHWGK